MKAQIFSGKDVHICKDKFQLAVEKNLENKPIGDVIVAIGKSFTGTDYEAHTLEKGKTESLVINLTGLDCTTFLENTLAFARLIKEKKNSFNDYEKELTKIRYRDGIINQYPSRLNYFSDWIYDNEKKGIVKNISKELGGIPVRFEVDFMSTHPGSYIELKEHPEFIPVIRSQEKEISGRTYYFIPKTDVVSVEDKIESGDLIAFTSAVKGLDINHVGIAVRMDDGKIHLLNAPNVGYKVQINKLPLVEYLQKEKKDTGIMVLRALEPNIKTNPIGDSEIDKELIMNIEHVWLKSLHDRTALNTILASDFVHVLPQGIFITKKENIDWEVHHPLPEGYVQKFDTLYVRVYGDTGIANGIVETFGAGGMSVRKSIFTDVFEKRNGSWQAVNAQENLVQ